MTGSYLVRDRCLMQYETYIGLEQISIHPKMTVFINPQTKRIIRIQFRK